MFIIYPLTTLHRRRERLFAYRAEHLGGTTAKLIVISLSQRPIYNIMKLDQTVSHLYEITLTSHQWKLHNFKASSKIRQLVLNENVPWRSDSAITILTMIEFLIRICWDITVPQFPQKIRAYQRLREQGWAGDLSRRIRQTWIAAI